MAVTFVEKADNTATAGTSVVVTKGGSTANGHVLLAAVCYDSNVAITPPAGWTLVHSGANAGNTFFLKTYWKVASSEGANWTWSFGGSANICAAVVTYSGADGSNPVLTFGGPDVTASSTTVTSTGGFAAVGNTVVVRIFSAKTSTTFTTATSHTERVDTATAGDGLAVDELAIVAPGSFGSATSTISFAADNIGAFILLGLGAPPELTPLWMPTFTTQPAPVRRIAQVFDTLDGRVRPDTEDVTATMAWDATKISQPRMLPRLRTPAETVLNPLPDTSSGYIPFPVPVPKTPKASHFDRTLRRPFIDATFFVVPPPLVDSGDVKVIWVADTTISITRHRPRVPGSSGQRAAPIGGTSEPPPPVAGVPLLSWVHAWASQPRQPKRTTQVPSQPGRLLDLSDAVALFTISMTPVERPRHVGLSEALLVSSFSKIPYPPPESIALWLWPQQPDRTRRPEHLPGPTQSHVFWPLNETPVVSWAVAPQIPRPMRKIPKPSTSQTLLGTVGPPAIPFVQFVTPRYVRPIPWLGQHTTRPPQDPATIPADLLKAFVTQQSYTPRPRLRIPGGNDAPTTTLPDPWTTWYVDPTQPRRLHKGHARSETWASPPLYASGASIVVLGPYVVANGAIFCPGAVVGDVFSE